MKANKNRISDIIGLAVIAVVLAASSTRAQTPMGSTPATPKSDTAIIFVPSEPLIKSPMQVAREYPNSWGINASFSDYGFGAGLYMGHSFSADLAAAISAEIGTATGAHEFNLVDVNKINRIFVIPIMASLEYRLFRDDLSDNLRPFVTAGAGPVVAMTTPYALDFFTAFGSESSKVIPGGFVGLGAKFGTDPKSTFGASLRYYYIPYPGEIVSTTNESLNNLSGIFLTVSYGSNF